MLVTGSTVKEALNKHIIKMRVCVWGGVPVQSAGDCEEGYWLYWIKAVQRCQQAGPQYHTLKERQLAVCLPRTQVPESGFSFAFPKYHGFYVQY